MHCHYIVNSLYPHNKAGRLWIENTQKIYQQIQQRPVWGQIITSRQLIYSALDIYCQAMKLHPNDITVTLEKIIPRYNFYDYPTLLVICFYAYKNICHLTILISIAS